jgi:hypothetical protein
LLDYFLQCSGQKERRSSWIIAASDMVVDKHHRCANRRALLYRCIAVG